MFISDFISVARNVTIRHISDLISDLISVLISVARLTEIRLISVLISVARITEIRLISVLFQLHENLK